MKLEKALGGDWINLEQAQSFYIAEMTDGPFAPKQHGYRVGLYARYSPSQVYVLKIIEPTQDTPEDRGKAWVHAMKELDALANELRKPSDVNVLEFSPARTWNIEADSATAEKLRNAVEKEMKDVKPTKRAPRKKAADDE